MKLSTKNCKEKYKLEIHLFIILKTHPVKGLHFLRFQNHRKNRQYGTADTYANQNTKIQHEKSNSGLSKVKNRVRLGTSVHVLENISGT